MFDIGFVKKKVDFFIVRDAEEVLNVTGPDLIR